MTANVHGGDMLVRLRCLSVAVGAIAFGAAAACGAELRIATWNIQTLTTGKKVFEDQAARTDSDLQALRSYAQIIAADIIALQEIASPAAAAQVFPAAQWTICISGQFFESYPQLGEPAKAKCFGEAPLPDVPPDAPSAKQFTAYAMRKTAEINVTISDLPELGVIYRDPKDGAERPVRWGLVAQVRRRDNVIATLLNVHLKSGCRSDHPWRIKRDSPQFPVCHTLGEQVRPLADFVHNTSTPFVIVGDFNRRLGPRDMVLLRLTGGHTPKNPHDDVALEHFSAEKSLICPVAPKAPVIDHFLLSSGLKGDAFQLHAPPLSGEADRLALMRTFGDHCAISLRLVWQTP